MVVHCVVGALCGGSLCGGYAVVGALCGGYAVVDERSKPFSVFLLPTVKAKLTEGSLLLRPAANKQSQQRL